ncbi:MAG: HNH endonuclease [Cryomorphaceae bacterium]
MTDEKIKYDELLTSDKWTAKRAEILNRDANACASCGEKLALQVHHKQYHTDRKTGKFVPPWQYHSKYLITLCGSCHEAGHSQYQIPVKYI